MLGFGRAQFTRVNFTVFLAGFLLLGALPADARAQEPAPPDSTAASADPDRVWWVGACVGSPQIIAFTVERRVSRGFHLQGHAGSAILVNSIGARLFSCPFPMP